MRGNTLKLARRRRDNFEFMDLFRDTDGFGRYTVRGYGRSYFTAGFGRYTIRLYGRSRFMAEAVPTLRTRNFTAIQKNPDSGN